jgi:pimeloyl-ACP methyl ester carboxylesterase
MRSGRDAELPHVRIDGGPETLVLLEGLGLENKAPTGLARSSLRWAYKAFARRYTVYQVTRRPRLPRGWTTRDMAADQARWMRDRFERPVDVLGVSTGGEVAQHLAADHPDLVRGLVLSDTACREGDEAKALLRTVREEAAAGRAAAAHRNLSLQMDMGRLGAPLLKLFGTRLLPAPADPSDYIATIEADLTHDATERLAAITAPTLVIAGTADFFYPEAIVRETAERIPGARLRLYEGVGHPVAKSHKRRWERDVLGFLSR